MTYLEFIKTLKKRKFNSRMFVVTIDIGSTTHYGYFRIINGEDIKPFSFSNDRWGFEELWDKICKFRDQHDLQEIIVGFESTGPYAAPLLQFLEAKPVFLVQINPYHTKRVKELDGNSPNKTDKKDPRVIADIICLGHVLTVVIPKGASAELRELTHSREDSVKRRTMLFNKIHSSIAKFFPEFSRIMKLKSKSAQFLMKTHFLPEEILELGVVNLTQILRRISRGKLGVKRAERLFDAAKNSVGICAGSGGVVKSIRHYISLIEQENEHISFIEKEMEKYLQEISYSKYILSIKGIGIVTAAGLIGEVGDFSCFQTRAEIMKLAGYDLYEISSGDHQGMRHISRRGRSLLRKILYFAALNVVGPNGILYEKYQSYKERNMPNMKALVAISRKLLGIIFALVRDQRMYEKNYSRELRLKRAA